MRPSVHVISRKKQDAIQYGYRKLGTLAKVFSQTLVHEKQFETILFPQDMIQNYIEI